MAKRPENTYTVNVLNFGIDKRLPLGFVDQVIDRKKFETIVEQYISENYKKLITPMLQRRDLGKGSKVHTPESAVKLQKQRIITYYLG